MKAIVYSQSGEKIGETQLPKEIFAVAMNQDLVHQVLVGAASNARRGTAHTKNRAEVSGGGRKPWRQKGTGRARHGSIRSPLWRGGGVTFGPRTEKNYTQRIPKKMRRKAVLMVLSAKAREKLLVVLDELKLEQPKTKLIFAIKKNLLKDENSSLIALPEMDKKVIWAARNLPRTETIPAKDLNVLKLLSYKYLILPKQSIVVIKETFVRK